MTLLSWYFSPLDCKAIIDLGFTIWQISQNKNYPRPVRYPIVFITNCLVNQFLLQNQNKYLMALMQVCRLLSGVSQPIHIFLEPRLQERLTHPSKAEFLPTSQSSKTQSSGLEFNKNSAKVLFPVFFTPTNITDQFSQMQFGRFIQGYVVYWRYIFEVDLIIASFFVFSIVFVIFYLEERGKTDKYLSNLVEFSYLFRLNMHVFEEVCDLILDPLTIRYQLSWIALIWVYMRSFYFLALQNLPT